jgi:hypothetical protein
MSIAEVEAHKNENIILIHTIYKSILSTFKKLPIIGENKKKIR